MNDVKEGYKAFPLHDAKARLARQQGWYVWLARAQVSGQISTPDTWIDKTRYVLSDIVCNLNDISDTTFRDPIPTSITGTLMPWDALATACRAYMIDEEQFENILRLEEYKPLGSVIGVGETELQLSESANAPPLALLRKFFMQKHAIPLINYIEKTSIVSPSQSKTKYASAHLDFDKIEDDMRQNYPYPYMDPGSWNINHFKVPTSVFEQEPSIDDLVIWESVLCPVMSTYRYLESLVHSVNQWPSYRYIGLEYNAENDSWKAPVNYSRQKKLAPISLLQLQYQFTIPVPRSLHDLQGVDEIALCDLWVNGFSWMATVLWRLYHLHRLKAVAVRPDDRCLLHATQLVIDSHIPLYAYNVKHGTFHDAFHLQKVPFSTFDGPTPKSKHPLAPAALNEYGGIYGKPKRHEHVKSTQYPRVFMLYPGMTRWLVTVEESPSLIPALNMSGFFFRYSSEHTAIQNWDDPKTAFITLMVSKMSQFRSRLRADDTTAKHCFTKHPIMASILLNYKHIFELGNTHGESKRPAFQDRIRLWLTYKDPETAPRSIEWVVDHCFRDFRYATRFAMHEMMCYYINLIPAFKQCMLSHPHQGVMYKEWMTTVKNAAQFHRNRLETIPLLPGAPKSTVILYNDILLCRLYNATNKHLNFCCHYGTFSDVLETFFPKEYSSLLSRVEVTLRAFSKDHAPDTELKNQIEAKCNQLKQLAELSRSRHTRFDYDDDLFDSESGFNALGNAGNGSNGNGGNDEDDEDAAQKEHAVFEQFHDDTLYTNEGDIDLDVLADMLLTSNEAGKSGQPATAAADSTTPNQAESSSSSKSEQTGPELYCYSKAEMRAIHRILSDNILHIPILDDPGNEHISEMFNAMVWTTQRYHGARQTLPLKLLLLFGMSFQMLIRLYMIFIYYEQALPYHRISGMIKRLIQDYPQDCALLWRYLQLLKMFSTEQAILLPAHVAQNQRNARSHMVHLQSNSPDPAAITRMYYCASCRTWAHQLAQETSVYYAWNAQRKCFVMQTAQYSRANSLVNSASKPIKPQVRTTRFTNSIMNAYQSKSANSSHRVFKVLFKTDNWKAYRRDFINDLRVCDCESRKRVTTTMSSKVAQFLLPPHIRRSLHFQRNNITAEENRIWLQYARLAMIFPLRPAQEKELKRKARIYDAEMANKAGESTSNGATAEKGKKAGAAKKTGRGRKRKQPDSAKAGTSGDSDREDEDNENENENEESGDAANADEEENEEEFDVNGSPDKIPEQVRQILSRYWMNEPEIVNQTTAGMHHGTVFQETRPMIAAAAAKVDALDVTTKCGYPLLAFNGEGRMYILPTQYTCVAKACCFCARCGKVMVAFDWNYAPGVGYVCEDHPNEFPINFKYNGGLWPARTASSNPESVSAGNPFELVIQKQYHVTTAVQLQCLPTAWLNRYGFKNYMEAMGLTQILLDRTMTQLARDESFFCSTCDSDPHAKPAKKYWANTVPIMHVSRKKCRMQVQNFCQNHYKYFRAKLVKKQEASNKKAHG